MSVGGIEELQRQSQELAQSAEARQQWIERVLHEEIDVLDLARVWCSAVDEYQLGEGGSISEASIEEEQVRELTRGIVCARIIRNVVAGNSEGQSACFVVVPLVVSTLWKTTSFTLEGKEHAQVLTRTLVQLLSNLITQNDELQGHFWSEWLFNKERNCIDEQQTLVRSGADLFARLLQSNDSATSTAAQVLLLNCTITSSERSRSFSTSIVGGTLARSVLSVIQVHLDDDEREEESEEHQQALLDTDSAIHISLVHDEGELQKRRKRYESLGVLYAFFSHLFDKQLFGQLFLCLAPLKVEEEGVVEPLITFSQLNLLKLFDSYLHYGAATYEEDESGSVQQAGGLEQLLSTFEQLASWAEKVMADAVKEGVDADVDSRLVEVHVGLILVLQCLITLGLITDKEDKKEHPIGKAGEDILRRMRGSPFVQRLIALLHILVEFAPPVSPFKPSESQVASSAPTGHSLTSTGAAVTMPRKGPSLDNLKRDLVNLIGVLSYERSSADRDIVRSVQDTVRESGGIFDVMNMTQLDERNPYIRERAIFTLRNLLRGNQASQDLVAQLKPLA